VPALCHYACMSSAAAVGGDVAEVYDDVPSPAREAGVAVVGIAVSALVGYGAYLGLHLSNLHNGLLALTFTAVGLYVVRMRPGHRVGQLFVACGVLAAVMFFGRQYGLHHDPLPAAEWFAWVSILLVPVAMAASGTAIMLFPDGRPLSRRWGVVVAAAAVLSVVFAVPLALWPLDWSTLDLSFPLEVAGRDWAERVLWPATALYFQASQVLWAVAVIARFRRAARDETRQLRWFGYAVTVVGGLVVTGVAVWGTPLPGLLALPLIPIAAGVAILKYRLYDIDPVINKTIVVGAMLLVITAGYVAIVVGVGALLPVPDGILSLVATAAVAVVFAPLRRHAQRLADRLVYGHRATPYEALSRLSAHLADTPDGLLDGLAATVASAVGATEVMVWVGREDRMAASAAWPDPLAAQAIAALADLGSPRVQVRAVIHDGSVRGAITVAKPVGTSLTGAEGRVLADLVAQAGLIIDHQGQAAALQAAARRIVTAQDEARRRIERDLHDGAQQRLVTLALELGLLAERAAATGSADLTARARNALAQLLEATAELRELARGVHPMVLSQSGLSAALGALADRSAVPVRVTVDVDRRLPPEVEATAYFVVAEALTNAARHAAASSVTVGVALEPGGLRVVVADDGRGGAIAGVGSGLEGLADRLAALGAQLVVDSPASSGTRVESVIPCE
jgi:signal transduction histidine kinase